MECSILKTTEWMETAAPDRPSIGESNKKIKIISKKKKKKKKKVIDQSIELSEKKMVEEEEHKDIDRSRHGRQQESDLPTNRQIATDTDQ